MDEDGVCVGSVYRKHLRFAGPMWTAAGGGDGNKGGGGGEDVVCRNEVKSAALQIAVQMQTGRTLQTRQSAHTAQRVGTDRCR